MSKEKELAKNTAIITFGKICTQLISFFLLPLYTTILSTNEYGTVDLVITYSSLLLPLVTLAIEQALFRFLIDVRGNENDNNRIISTAVLFTIMQCLLVSVLVLFVRLLFNSPLIVYFWLILVTSTLSATALQLSRGFGDNIGYTLGSTATAIGQIICNVVFLVIFHMGAVGMMLATFFGNLACTIIIVYRCKLFQYIRIKYFNSETFKELLKYSIPLIPNQLSWWALNASDKVIVQIFIGIAGNGIIAVANKFPSMYIQFSNIFNISWMESAALHINDKDANIFFKKTITSVYNLFLCACCIIIVVLPFVFSFLINESYNKAYDLIPIFMLASLFNVIVSLYGVIYVAHKRTKEIAQTAIYAATINIFSHLILINFIGLYAAAVSTMLGYGCMAIYRYFHSRRYLEIKFSNKDLLISISMILISLVSYYITLLFVHILVLFIVVIMSVIVNKDTIYLILNYGMKSLKRKNKI